LAKIPQFIVFLISIWGVLELCLGGLSPPKPPRGDGTGQLSSAQRTLHLEVCNEVIHIYKLKQVKSVLTGLSIEASGSHSIGRDPNRLRFRRGSENRLRRGDQNLNLSCNSSNLFACLFVV